jgi:hypothetical protein
MQHAGEGDPQMGRAMKRRGLLAGAAALVAGIAAKHGGQPVTANDGIWTLPYTGTVSAPSTWAFFVNNTSTAGASQAIQGSASSVGVGGSGRIGLFGVSGGANSGLLVGSIGVGGQCLQADGTGVSGYVSTGSNSKAVYGKNTSNGYAVYGESASGRGVYGTSNGDNGVFGNTNAPASSGYSGVHGVGNGAGTFGVTGNGAGGTGVSGFTSGLGSYGVQGSSAVSHGVVGLSGNTAGASGVVAVGQSPGAVGFQGVAQGGALYAGYFYGDVSINKRVSDGMGGNLGVAGAKFAIVKGQDGKYRGMYAVESPECWFEDFGTGKVVAGKAAIALDPLFAQHVHTDDYHVFITPHDAEQHLAVTVRSAAGFVVAASASAEAVAKGKKASDLNGTFSYRVVAKRNDIAGERMPLWDMAPGVDGTIVPVAVPSSPAKEPPQGPPPQAAPSPRPSTASTPVAQGTAPTAGTGASAVQPAPPPRP